MSECKEVRQLRNVEFSQIENLHVVRGEDINGTGRLYGGRLLSWIDETAATCAQRHSGLEITTASIDNLTFKRGAYSNDVVVLVAKVTYVGRTSMEVRVDTYVEDKEGYRHPINRAYLTYVAITREGIPVPIPYGLELSKENEKMEWEAAILRKNNRKLRAEEGF